MSDMAEQDVGLDIALPRLVEELSITPTADSIGGQVAGRGEYDSLYCTVS
jgi:hypothetical protein